MTGSRPHGVDLRVLGPVEWVVAGQPVPVGHPKQRAVLAVLAVDANRLVPTEQLIDRVWGDAPPVRVRNVLSGYVARLRASLSRGGARLAWQSGGYRLDIAPELVDLWRFRQLAERAGKAAGEERLALFDDALGLWRGPAFGGAASEWLRGLRDSLDAERLAIEIARADEALGLGRQADLLVRLPDLAVRYPLNEKVAGQLMLALYRAGREADALATFADLRARLRRILGVDPGPSVRDLHRRILVRDPALAPASTPLPAAGGPPGPAGGGPAGPAGGPAGGERPAGGDRLPTVPRQLPAAPASFTGRAAYLRRLDRGSGVITIAGPPGTGKTALAVHWAHQAAGRYPDGQLYLDLRGFDPHQPPVSPAQALGRLLRDLGVPAERIPLDADEQASLYRSTLAGGRVLIVLDNAASSEQVRPLLPGAAGCLVVVTSRNRLDGLATREAAHGLVLGVLTPAESAALLARVLGRRRAAAEPDGVRELAELCGRLPLALRIAANHLVTRPGLRVADLVGQLTDQHHRLDTLATEDPAASVRAVFSLSYRGLDAPTARAFRLVGLVTGPTLGVPAAAALLDVPQREAARLLDGLAQGHLLEPAGSGRYQVHDLLRVYAAELVGAQEPQPVRAAAVRRLLSWYVGAVQEVDRLLSPRRYRSPVPPGEVPDPPVAVATFAEALGWCDAEAPNLLAAVRQADAAGAPDLAWQLAFALAEFFELRKPWNDWLSTYRIGLAAARRCGNRPAEAAMLYGLGSIDYYPRRFRPALARYRQAYRIWREAGDAWGEGIGLNGIGNVLLETRRLDRAVACYDQALRRLRDLGVVREEGVVLCNLAEAQCLLGRYADALGYALRSLEISKLVESHRTEVFALCHAANALAGLGREVEARDHLENALSLAIELKDRHGTAWTFHYLGELAARRGRAGEARTHWQRAVELFDTLGDPQADDLRRRLGDLTRPTD